MAFKFIIGDKGKAWRMEKDAEFLIGKSIGDKIDGKEFGGDLDGYEFEMTMELDWKESYCQKDGGWKIQEMELD